MKDFVLSLLSRGYGQIVPNEDGHDGRLEVCFEPEDYFNWKSQPPLLRLTSSGRFFGGLDPVPPKTYSTRRGPLILYSEDLALAYRSGQVNRKRKALSCPKQEGDRLGGRISLPALIAVPLTLLAGELHLGLADNAAVSTQRAHTHAVSPQGVFNFHTFQKPAWTVRRETARILCDQQEKSNFNDTEKIAAICNRNGTLTGQKGNDPGDEISMQHEGLDGDLEQFQGKGPLVVGGLCEVSIRHVQLQQNSKVGSLAGVTHPLLPDTKHAIQNVNMRHRPGDKNSSQPRFLCSPRPNRADVGPLPPITDVQIQEKSQAAPDEQLAFKTGKTGKDRKRALKSLRIAVDTCRAHMSPIPETEAARTEPAHQTPETKKTTPTILPHQIDHPKDLNGRGKRSRMESGGGVGETCTLRSVYVDSSQEYSPLSRVNYYGGHMEGSRQMRHCGGETHMRRVNTETDPSFTVFHLPPINQSPLVKSGSDITLTLNKTDIKEKKSSCENLPKRELHVHLPDIKVGTAHENPSERRVHSKVLLLFPAQTEHADTHQPDDDLHRTPVKETEPRLKHALGPDQRKQDPLSDNKCRIIEMDLGHVMWSDELEKGDQHPPLGPLPPLVGRRGPGKQSSMAVYRQNLHDPADETEGQTGNTREWQGGKAVGTLIMGPDGEIIRLSLWDPAVDTEDHPIMADVTQGHVLKVVTSEGDLKQPWTILIQDNNTDEEGVEGERGVERRSRGLTHSAQQECGTKCSPSLQRMGSPLRSHSLTGEQEDTTSNTEETLNTEQLDSSHEGFKVNKTAEKTNAKKKQHPLGSHNKTDRMRQVFKKNSHEETNAEEEQEEETEEEEEEEEEEDEEEEEEDEEEENDSDSQISQKERVIKVRPRAKQTKAKRKENRLGADNEISQENQVFKVKARAKQTNAKRDDCLGADSEVIQEEEVFKVRSRINQTNIKRKDDCSGADSEIIHEAQVYLPEERLEEMSSSTTHRLNKTGEEVTGVQRNRKVKTTTLQPETKVTRGSRKSKGAAPDRAISPKSTRAHSPESLSPEGQAEIQAGLPTEADFDRKGHSKNAGGREDIEHTLVEKVKKNKKSNKQTGKSKGKSVQIHEDIETQNISIPDDFTSTSMKKKKKTGKEKKEDAKEKKEENIKAQNSTVKVKTKKGQPAFVVAVMTHDSEDDDDQLENTENTQEHNYTAFEDDMDADTDSESADTHEAHECSPRSVYSTYRSEHSLITARSDASIHRLSQSSIRTTSMGTLSHCGPSLAEKAERRRLEVEKKRKEREEEKKRQQEKEVTEERMRMELEEEQRKRAEEARLRKIREEDERQRRQEEEMERQRRERAEKDRERRRQEEKRRLLERLQRERQEEEKRQAAQLERQRLEEEARKEEELRKLSEMEEAERLEYLRRRQEEEEERRKAAEERRRKEEEAAMHAEEEARLQAELFARGLFVEAEGLEQTQDISRPWIFSYFTLLKLLGLAEPTSEDTLNDVL
ncbi:hypothetical protein H4Q32_008101 [Labeo rohita]|uniref:Trichohyalin-like n=1 Tax=Labeo rohita TaxID=84645 RepID=A0ABQ8MCB1_LABRO|nr:hypothetical protein H4Q32_008101 [Labeo rohita]